MPLKIAAMPQYLVFMPQSCSPPPYCPNRLIKIIKLVKLIKIIKLVRSILEQLSRNHIFRDKNLYLCCRKNTACFVLRLVNVQSRTNHQTELYGVNLTAWRNERPAYQLRQFGFPYSCYHVVSIC